VSDPAEKISVDEVRAAIAKAKDGKAAGPSGIVSEMLNNTPSLNNTASTLFCASHVQLIFFYYKRRIMKVIVL